MFFFFSSRRRHTRYWRDWEFRRVLFRSRVNGNGRSMGMALTSCTVPAAGRPTFDLPDDEMEIGIGIHGEPGRRRVPLAPAREVAGMLVEPVPIGRASWWGRG